MDNEKLTDKQIISTVLGPAKSRYISDLKAYVVKNRGIIWTAQKKFSHKWKENGKEYNFCLKCGCPKEVEKYYTHGCPMSARQYNKYMNAGHTYEEMVIPKLAGMWFGSRGTYSFQEQEDFTIRVCKKCGLIESREKVFYRLDKETGNAYEVPSPVGAKRKTIHCNLTDDAFDIKDILI